MGTKILQWTHAQWTLAFHLPSPLVSPPYLYNLWVLPPKSLWSHTHSPAAPVSGGLCRPACHFWRRIWGAKGQQRIGLGRGRNELAETSTRKLSSSRDGSNRSLSFLPAHRGSMTVGGLTLCGKFQTWFLCFGSPFWSPGDFGWCLIWRADHILQEWEKKGLGYQGFPRGWSPLWIALPVIQ